MANDRRESVLRHLRRLIVSRAESDLSDDAIRDTIADMVARIVGRK